MIIVDVDPVAFSIGGIAVRWYGIMVALAVLIVVVWALVAVRRGAGFTYDTVINAAIVGIPSGVIFSRALHVIDLWDYYRENPYLIIGGAGLTIWGAVLGAAIGIWVYSRFKKVSFGRLADTIAPAIILAQAVGRVGCAINGCCHGMGTDLPWAFVYMHPASEARLGVPVHPTQIYEIIYNLMVFAVLLSLRGKLRGEGVLFSVYLLFYSVWRLGIDFLREGREIVLGMHQPQLISIIVIIFVVAQLIVMRRRSVPSGTRA
ncbi:MAG: prolipoprotein diacylglyceryl transferase [Dehalococcoidales bacterium]|nr:prolipoprotein diacylglyceryl transferase [Dehalococcoidales bacterium]